MEVPANLHSVPIVFKASLVPVAKAAADSGDDSDFSRLHPATPAKRGFVAYFIRYELPASAFAAKTVDGHPQIEFDLATVDFNQLGEEVSQNGQRVHLTFSVDNPTQPVRVEQQIDLKKGDNYLSLAVWNTVTRSLGALEVPITVK